MAAGPSTEPRETNVATTDSAATRRRSSARPAAAHAPDLQIGKPGLPGQVVLVLQGGGALGPSPVGVSRAGHEPGMEPDGVTGPWSGAIKAARIGGTRPEDRRERCGLGAGPGTRRPGMRRARR